MASATCRFCKAPLSESFADLGMSPLSNAFLRETQLDAEERFFPLHAYVCGECFLVQVEEFESPDRIFQDYAYFSSFSESWLQHVKDYTAKMTQRFGLGANSRVVELASNDGYLLQYFKENGIPVLGIEPAANVAEIARKKGIPTEVLFFGEETAGKLLARGCAATLLVGNNVLAHVPDLNGFVRGMKILLKPDGILTMEFPHLLRLIEQNQFDTIYHEHFSYFSFFVVERIFAYHGLTVFDVEELPTHGGSLRIYARHPERADLPVAGSVSRLRGREKAAGLQDLEVYRSFGERLKRAKREVLAFLARAKQEGKRVVGYGAAAKGNTLMNYCAIGSDFIECVVDRNPHKQDLYLPGSHIPIRAPDVIRELKPDYLLILPWNLRAEIMEQMSYIREWGGKFVTPIPHVEIF